jgi:hypothetical protein
MLQMTWLLKLCLTLIAQSYERHRYTCIDKYHHGMLFGTRPSISVYCKSSANPFLLHLIYSGTLDLVSSMTTKNTADDDCSYCTVAAECLQQGLEAIQLPSHQCLRSTTLRPFVKRKEERERERDRTHVDLSFCSRHSYRQTSVLRREASRAISSLTDDHIIFTFNNS